ncbi:MAG TPA: divergent polysaccharide deacetylase family protein [Thermodesulfobacteriota bacterium]|nr:divergent polysaccharide deacetylase family protein [Thermodesulfobacteriota bacterium]
MARSKKRPAPKRKRVNRARKNKGKRVILATFSFIVLVAITLAALNLINSGISRDESRVRITEDELSSEIKKIDSRLNEIFSEIGLKKAEIISKNNYKRNKDDINWDYKEVSIKTDNTDKFNKFNKKFASLTGLKNITTTVKKNKNSTNSSLDIFTLSTHKINFHLEIPKPVPAEVPSKPEITKKEISPTAVPNRSKTKSAADGKEFAFLYGLKTKPKIAIIVDDIGASKKSIDDLLKIPASINMAVLPDLKYSHYAASRANSKGWDVLLHMPMEPKYASGYTGIDAGENALLTGLPKKEIMKLVEKNLAAVPHIKGVNNHMGSKFTESDELMNLVLKKVKKEGLFFIDSKTSPQSRGYDEAKKLGLKTAERDVFLDKGKEGERFIRARVNELLRISKKQGYAVGICHPYPQTIRVLSDMIPKLKNYVEFIPASQIVN